MSEPLLVESRDGGVCLLELNRPDKANAYTPHMGEALVSALRAAAVDEEIHAVILTGRGDAFCAGADLDYLRGQSEGGLKLGEEEFIASFTEELAQLPVLTIAVINGSAAGIGITGVLAFDIRLAAADAKLVLNFAELGILPGLGASYFLPRLLGPDKSRELLLCQRRVTGAQAAEMGLVSEALPAEQLMQRARQLADAAADCRPGMIGGVKRALDYGAGVGLADALAMERVISGELRR